MRQRTIEPDPRRLWIRHWVEPWPGAPSVIPWVHVGAARPQLVPERAASDARDPQPTVAALAEPPYDCYYLPPTRREDAAERDGFAIELLESGVPVVVHAVTCSDLDHLWEHVMQPQGRGGADVWIVVDLLAALLTAQQPLDLSARPRALRQRCVALWPLIPGVSDRGARAEKLMSRMPSLGYERIVVEPLELRPSDRRELVDFAGEEAFDALFHDGQADRDGCHGWRLAAGLDDGISRPLPAATERVLDRRRAAADLIRGGELLERLHNGREASELFAAARWLEQSDLDIRSAVREENLHVLTWLSDRARHILEEHFGASSEELGRLELEYTERLLVP